MKNPSLAKNRSPNWAFMQKFEVPDPEAPEYNYLTRWRVVQTPLFGLYVHRIDGPDPQAQLHDHPWSFLSIVLRGGYIERHYFGWRRIRRFNFKKAEDLHYIIRLTRFPTWTLLFVGRRRRVWGWMDPDGTWTRFDEHRHNLEFIRAMDARKAMSGRSDKR